MTECQRIWQQSQLNSLNCRWNGNIIFSQKKVVTPTITGSTSSGTLTPTALLTGALVVLENGKIFSGQYTNETKDHALTICKNILSDISAMSKIGRAHCSWH